MDRYLTVLALKICERENFLLQHHGGRIQFEIFVWDLLVFVELLKGILQDDFFHESRSVREDFVRILDGAKGRWMCTSQEGWNDYSLEHLLILLRNFAFLRFLNNLAQPFSFPPSKIFFRMAISILLPGVRGCSLEKLNMERKSENIGSLRCCE